jgi:hypothetical protein
MPSWQSNFNKNSVTAKLVSEIAVHTHGKLLTRKYCAMKSTKQQHFLQLTTARIRYDKCVILSRLTTTRTKQTTKLTRHNDAYTIH